MGNSLEGPTSEYLFFIFQFLQYLRLFWTLVLLEVLPANSFVNRTMGMLDLGEGRGVL